MSLKPIPPEAAAQLDALKAFQQTFAGRMEGPAAREQLAKGVADRTLVLTALLRGTAAEPLLSQQRELMREFNKALSARDQARIQQIKTQMDASAKELDRLLHAAARAAAPAPQPTTRPEIDAQP